MPPANPSVRAHALIVLDGVGDRPDPALAGRTPLEAAPTPHLDSLLSRGASGLLSVLGPGVAPESDAGVFALLGYDPIRDSPGRGVLEALGAEVPLARGDVALRLNFATLGPERSVLDARVGRSLATEEANELARDLTEGDLLKDLGIQADVRSTVGHRGVLWLHPRRGGPLSPEISNADPFYERVGGLGQALRPQHPRVDPVRPLDQNPASARTAEAVNQLLDRALPRLEAHPLNAARRGEGRKVANGLLLRDAGSLPAVPAPRFSDVWGVAGAALTEMPVERGIARILGLEDRFVGPMQGDRDAGYRDRARVARGLLERFPFVYVHLKGPDEPGHDGDPERKRDIVEAIDRSFFGPFLEGLDLGACRVAVAADHATPCVVHGHSDDPVPLLLAGGSPGGAKGPTPVKFGEGTGSRGALGVRRGEELLELLFGRRSSRAGR